MLGWKKREKVEEEVKKEKKLRECGGGRCWELKIDAEEKRGREIIR